MLIQSSALRSIISSSRGLVLNLRRNREEVVNQTRLGAKTFEKQKNVGKWILNELVCI